MLAVVLASVGFGVLLTLLAQCLWIKRRFGSLPKLPIPTKQQTESFQLPKELLKLIGDPEVRTKKQSCLFLNLIFQFLFREIKDTKFVRRWVVRKLNAEFAELLQTTSGKLLDRISVRDFNFGSTFPIVHTAAVKHVQMSEDEQCIEELDMALDIEYRGGFHLAVDADLVFGKSAYLSVRVMELKGCLRLQLSRHPYTHWSLAFYEEPTMDFSVESRFEGRPIPQITSLIVNQIRRSIRKKHTLPNYKMRFKPFFLPPEPALPARDLFFRGSLVGQGGLEVTVIECSRLLKPPADSLLYCTVSLGSLTWLESIRVRKTFITHDVEIIRQAGQPIGMLFKEDFLLERYESVVVIESVSGDSPAAYVDIRKNDILVAVGGQKVTSQKQAAKLLKNSGERIMVRLERAVLNKNADNADLRFDEDFISVKDGEVPGKEGTAAKSQEEDFVNISVRPVNGETKSLQGSPPREQSPYKRPSVTSFLRRRTRSSVGVGTGAGDSPQSSPESRRKTVGTAPEQKDRTRDPLSRSPLTSPKKQSMLKSDKTLSNSDTQINILGKSGLSSASLDDAGRFEDDVDSDSDLDDETEMRRTALVASCQDPLWNEKFRFEVEEGQRYLNVCVWCKIPEKLDRNEKLVKAEKDMLLGYVSLPLCDVALDCLMTLQGDSQRTVHLSPMETKAGASRAKLPSLGGHPGFEPTLCYGDITLGFVHTPYRVGMEGRKRLTKHPSAPTFTFTQHPNHPGEDNSSNKLDEGQHTFILTQFHTATYCGFCGKKIWLKTAFQCHLCHMICHKKCTEKCQAQTLCRKDGVRRRSQPDVLYKTPAAAVEADKKKSGDENVSRTSGILSKFRKDSTGKRGRSSSPAADRTVISGNQIRVDRSPFFIRRRNSAPDDNDSDCSSGGGGLLTVESMPRTRSTTSLQNLVSQNARPTLTSDELKNVEKQGESSSEEGELTVSQTGSITKRHNVDEMVVTAAKQMGRELFSHLKLEERKEKLDAMVSKLQQEIDVESEHRAELSRAEQESVDPTQKRFLLSKISKADEKIQALMVLMLHYCAGLQNCMDLEEEQRQLLDENMENEKKKELGTGAANGDDSKHIIEGVNSDFPDIPQGCIHGGSDELDYVGDLESSSEFDMDVRF